MSISPFDPPVAIHEQAMNRIAERLAILDLDGAPGIYEQSVPDDQTQEVIGYPAILLAPFGVEQIAPGGGTNERSDIGYPVVIVLVTVGNLDQSEGRNQRVMWRQQIVESLEHQPVEIVQAGACCFDISIEPADIAALPAWMGKMKAASFLTARVWVRVARGTH